MMNSNKEMESKHLQKYFIETVNEESITHKKMWNFFIKYVSDTDSLNEQEAKKLLNDTMDSIQDWLH